jgi:predicted transcriptional regulator
MKKKLIVSITMDPELNQALIDLMQKTERSKSYLINDSLKHYLKIFKD